MPSVGQRGINGTIIGVLLAGSVLLVTGKVGVIAFDLFHPAVYFSDVCFGIVLVWWRPFHNDVIYVGEFGRRVQVQTAPQVFEHGLYPGLIIRKDLETTAPPHTADIVLSDPP